MSTKGVILHYPHSIKLEGLGIDNRSTLPLKIVSIDPGVVNYGFRIETRYPGGIVKTEAYRRKTLVNGADGLTWSVDLNNFLDSHDYDGVKLIFIEKQLYFSAKASRAMESTISYFITKLKDTKNLPLIYEVPPRVKWVHLSESKPPNVKSWSIAKATQLLSDRRDLQGLSTINTNRKKDDLADVVTQSEAMIIELGLHSYVTRSEPYIHS